jgi:hypothetical protein
MNALNVVYIFDFVLWDCMVGVFGSDWTRQETGKVHGKYKMENLHINLRKHRQSISEKK